MITKNCEEKLFILNKKIIIFSTYSMQTTSENFTQIGRILHFKNYSRRKLIPFLKIILGIRNMISK